MTSTDTGQPVASTFSLGLRRRSMGALFTAVALITTAMTSASTAGTLLVSQTNGPAWSGLPQALGIIGTASGALSAGTLIARRGKRTALLTMFGLAVLGAAIAFWSAITATLPTLAIGMVLLGFGNGGAQLARYVAADLYPAERTGSGLSAIVWAGTVGAVGGPAMIAPVADAAKSVGLPELAGPYGFAALAMATAAAASAALPRELNVPEAHAQARLSLTKIRAELSRRDTLTPLAAMVAAQMTMVAVMTITPVQLHEHGHGLGVVGGVIGVHMFGMFALAPLSGRISDRWGSGITINIGIATLVVSTAVGFALPTEHTVGLPVALFLLGYGWNLVFVGGSSALSHALSAEHRSRLRGVVDACVWGSSGLAGLMSGQLFINGGFALVTLAGAAVALAPLLLLLRR